MPQYTLHPICILPPTTAAVSLHPADAGRHEQMTVLLIPLAVKTAVRWAAAADRSSTLGFHGSHKPLCRLATHPGFIQRCGWWWHKCACYVTAIAPRDYRRIT